MFGHRFATLGYAGSLAGVRSKFVILFITVANVGFAQGTERQKFLSSKAFRILAQNEMIRMENESV